MAIRRVLRRAGSSLKRRAALKPFSTLGSAQTKRAVKNIGPAGARAAAGKALGKIAKPLVKRGIAQFKNIRNSDLGEITDFVDRVGRGAKAGIDNSISTRRLAKRFGVNPNVSDRRLSGRLTKLLDATPNIRKKLVNTEIKRQKRRR